MEANPGEKGDYIRCQTDVLRKEGDEEAVRNPPTIKIPNLSI